MAELLVSPATSDGYRFVISGNYIAFYRYVDDKVFVNRVLYSSRDYVKVLFG